MPSATLSPEVSSPFAVAVMTTIDPLAIVHPLLVLGQTVTVRVSARQSGGAYALFEVACPPGTGTPPHRELGDETFYVLEGTMTFLLDGRPVTAGPGECVFVPAGAPHAEANASDRPARVLTLSMLGARKEAMFCALAALPTGGPVDVGAVVAICAAHGVEILPEPGRHEPG